MPQNWEYVAAAYGIWVVTFAAYALWLARRSRLLARALRRMDEGLGNASRLSG